MTRMSKNPKSGIVYDVIEIACGALAAKDLILSASAIDAAKEMGFRILKSQIFASFLNKTADEGGVLFGYAFNPDSAAAVEEAIEADPQSDSRLARLQNEQAMRPVFPIGLIHFNATDGVLFNGAAIEIKPQWSIPEGGALQYWAYNVSPSAPLTTGCIIQIQAKHFGVWLND